MNPGVYNTEMKSLKFSFLFLSILALALLSGCGSSSSSSNEGPEAAAKKAFTAITEQDGAALCESISSSGQKAIVKSLEQAKKANAQLPEKAQKMNDLPKDITCESAFEWSLENNPIDTPSVEDINFIDVKETGDTAILSAEANGEKEEINMVKEDGVWKLDVSK